MWKYLKSEVEQNKIPNWLSEQINKSYPNYKCKCGYDLIINSMHTYMRCCNYKKCLPYMASRLEVVCKFFKWSSYGIAKCKEILSINGCTNHMQGLEYIREKKQPLYLWQIAKLCQFDNLADKWEEELRGYNSFSEYYSSIRRNIELSKDDWDLLFYAETLFDKKPILSEDTVEIMITNGVMGYKSKQEFIDTMNEKYGSVINSKLVPHVKKSADVLIYDYGAKGIKYTTAINSNGRIRILTSKEYEALLLNLKMTKDFVDNTVLRGE